MEVVNQMTTEEKDPFGSPLDGMIGIDGRSKSVRRILVDSLSDKSIQPRGEMDEAAVSDYENAYNAGKKLPPITVFKDGDHMYLVDGFHRLEAIRRTGSKTIGAMIYTGTHDDATYEACGSNKAHGVRRNNKDKRKAAAIALMLKPKMSDSSHAEHVGVSQPFVSKIRRELAGAGYDELKVEVRRARDGREIDISAIQSGGIESPPGDRPLPSPGEPGPTPEPKPAPPKDFHRALEIKSLIRMLEKVEKGVVSGLEDDDPLFRELRKGVFTNVTQQAINLLKDHCIPAMECPYCGGKPGGCKECYGRGWLSRRGAEIAKADD